MQMMSHLFKRILMHNSLKKKAVKLKSYKASLKANYGIAVSIGKNTVISNDVRINDYTYVNSNSYLENCDIGKFCSISSGVHICPVEHKLEYISTHPITKYDIKRNKVVIGNDVLICLNAIILEGVTIGDGAVIGAGAVVTKNVMPYEIVGGVPAKHLKWRFSKEKTEYLLNLKWWNWNYEKIEKNIPFLRNEDYEH